jgi:putative ABC transport system substrate-binding protein
MASHLGRRNVLKLLGSAPLAWSHAAHAQQKLPLVVYVSASSGDQGAQFAFAKGLAEQGFIDGKNVTVEHQWAYGKHDLLPKMMADAVSRGVTVLGAGGASSAARAAKAITSTIPIVFVMGDADPVQAGVVQSLSRPGGNITGASLMGGELGVKRVGLIRDLLPKATAIAVLANPRNPVSEPDRKEVEAAARERGLRPIVIEAGDPGEFEAAFASMAQQRADALIVTADPFFTVHRKQLVELAAKHAIPAIYQWRFFSADGGLMSYGASITDANRQAGIYAGRILKGAKPGELPVLQPTTFEFVINLKTAKTLGLTFPPGLLAIADEVIE